MIFRFVSDGRWRWVRRWLCGTDRLKIIQLIVFIMCSMSPAAFADTPLWSANMEGGNLVEWAMNGCGGQYVSGNSRIDASTLVAHTGKWSARLQITTPGTPTSGARLFRWCEPREHAKLFYSAWFYLPEHYSVRRYWNVFQWKSKTAKQNDPFFIVNIGNRADGTMYFYLFDWQRRRSYPQTGANLRIGNWVHLEAYHECTAASTGRVTVWQDGGLLHDLTNVTTRYNDGDCQWSIDNYSDGLTPATATLFVDDATISLRRSN
jgi:hypothetical protein